MDLIIDKFDFFKGWESFIIGFNFPFYPVFVNLLHRGGHLISRQKQTEIDPIFPRYSSKLTASPQIRLKN